MRSRETALSTFIENIVRVPLMEDPGTRYRYSEGTTVLGRLVEIWSGKPLDVFFAERIFKPLRMIDTAFWGTVLIGIAAVLTIGSMVWYLKKALPEIRARVR